MSRVRLLASLLWVVGTAHVTRAGAQTDTSRAGLDSAAALARCEAVVRAARVDSVASGLFIGVQRLDGGELNLAQAAGLANQIGAMFTAPMPFPLTVFAGPVVMRALTLFGTDTAGTLRGPSVLGVYRLATGAGGTLRGVGTVRASLTPGFDSAAVAAIREAAALPGGLSAPNRDSMMVDVRIGSDSEPGALKLVGAYFPRMPVVDARPRRGNPAPPFPEDEQRDSVESGEVMLRFVVDRYGRPVPATVEVVRATSTSFYRAAASVVPLQAFDPATIRGCAVAQVVSYPFTFVLPDSGWSQRRH